MNAMCNNIIVGEECVLAPIATQVLREAREPSGEMRNDLNLTSIKVELT